MVRLYVRHVSKAQALGQFGPGLVVGSVVWSAILLLAGLRRLDQGTAQHVDDGGRLLGLRRAERGLCNDQPGAGALRNRLSIALRGPNHQADEAAQEDDWQGKQDQVHPRDASSQADQQQQGGEGDCDERAHHKAALQVPAHPAFGGNSPTGDAGPNAAVPDLPGSLVRAGPLFEETDHGSVVVSICH
jgi:hypothetical protein